MSAPGFLVAGASGRAHPQPPFGKPPTAQSQSLVQWVENSSRCREQFCPQLHLTRAVLGQGMGEVFLVLHPFKNSKPPFSWQSCRPV